MSLSKTVLLSVLFLLQQVSNLFARDEIDEICGELIPVMKKEYPRRPPTPENLYDYFLTRAKRNLHLALCFSPVSRLTYLPMHACQLIFLSMCVQCMRIRLSVRMYVPSPFHNYIILVMYTSSNDMSEIWEFFCGYIQDVCCTVSSVLSYHRLAKSSVIVL